MLYHFPSVSPPASLPPHLSLLVYSLPPATCGYVCAAVSACLCLRGCVCAVMSARLSPCTYLRACLCLPLSLSHLSSRLFPPSSRLSPPPLPTPPSVCVTVSARLCLRAYLRAPMSLPLPLPSSPVPSLPRACVCSPMSVRAYLCVPVCARLPPCAYLCAPLSVRLFSLHQQLTHCLSHLSPVSHFSSLISCGTPARSAFSPARVLQSRAPSRPGDWRQVTRRDAVYSCDEIGHLQRDHFRG